MAGPSRGTVTSNSTEPGTTPRDPMDLPIVRPERDRVLPPRRLDRDEQLRRDQQRIAREAAERQRGPREGL